jgi:predicted DNA-binding WGR domain protein
MSDSAKTDSAKTGAGKSGAGKSGSGKSGAAKSDAAKSDAAKSDAAKSDAASPRRFEFVEGKSSKFWEVSRDGCDVTVRFGRIGADGQIQTKTFADEAAAKAHLDKLVEQKTDKGYTEIEG